MNTLILIFVLNLVFFLGNCLWFLRLRKIALAKRHEENEMKDFRELLRDRANESFERTVTTDIPDSQSVSIYGKPLSNLWITPNE